MSSTRTAKAARYRVAADNGAVVKTLVLQDGTEALASSRTGARALLARYIREGRAAKRFGARRVSATVQPDAYDLRDNGRTFCRVSVEELPEQPALPDGPAELIGECRECGRSAAHHAHGCPNTPEPEQAPGESAAQEALTVPGPGEAICPSCSGFKKLYVCCTACEGRGIPPASGDACDVCEGAGEVDRGRCGLCDQNGHVRMEVARLIDADAYVLRAGNESRAIGLSAAHRGVTKYAQAEYWRRRAELRGRALCAVGAVEPGRLGRAAEGLVVRLYGPNGGQPLAEFYGFAWGYGGEGPNGLADVLADCLPGYFPDRLAALRWVGRLDPEAGWKAGPGRWSPEEGG